MKKKKKGACGHVCKANTWEGKEGRLPRVLVQSVSQSKTMSPNTKGMSWPFLIYISQTLNELCTLVSFCHLLCRKLFDYKAGDQTQNTAQVGELSTPLQTVPVCKRKVNFFQQSLTWLTNHT